MYIFSSIKYSLLTYLPSNQMSHQESKLFKFERVTLFVVYGSEPLNELV